LGLLREESGIAGKVLRDLNVQFERVTELVERITGPVVARRSARSI